MKIDTKEDQRVMLIMGTRISLATSKEMIQTKKRVVCIAQAHRIRAIAT